MILPLLLALQLAPTDSGPVYAGRAHQLDVRIPRFDTASVTIDGVLDEPVWAHAAVLTSFSEYQPVDSRPSEERTEVLVWYGPTAIYFGIRAYELHGDVVRATHADRDNISADDQVQILLDTYNDRRRAYLFGVNPYGVQQDGIRSEGFAGGAGGSSAGGQTFTGNILDGNVDLNPDFVFESRGRLVPGGYVVEIRIPFKSIRYQGTAVQDWGINILRRAQHSGYQDSWAPVVRANASFLAQSGRLVGLHDLKRGLVLEGAPVLTAHATGAPDTAHGGWHYSDGERVGADARWGVTPNLSLTGTVNPDFSQVEADVGQVTVNQRFALSYPEKRPFFLEGLEMFDTPNRLIYTRQIVDPSAGIKLAGKIGATNVALLGAADGRDQSLTGSTPYFGAMRLRTDIGVNSTAGLVATTREDGADYSRLFGADVHVVHSRLYYVELQAVDSWTRTASGAVGGPLWSAAWDRTGRTWGFHYQLTGTAPDFNAAVGFVNRTGVWDANVFNRLTMYGRRGALLETSSAYITVNRVYDYQHFGSASSVEGGESLFLGSTLRGGWSLSPTIGRSYVAYTTNTGSCPGAAPYACYRVQGSGDTTAFTVPATENNLWSWSLQLTTPTYRQFTASASVSAGGTAIFNEAARGRAVSWSGAVDWRPAIQVRISGQWTSLAIDRDRDGSRFSSEEIPRLKIEYQLSRAIFLRFVGQYTAIKQDALFDSQGRPILVDDTLTVPSAANNLRVDWLFSFTPSPGTLIYLGYGSSLEEPSAFAFGRDLTRTQDGFFGKVSYLLRY